MDCGQVDKYSSGVPFTGEIAEIKPSEQQIQQMIDAFVPFAQGIIDAIYPLIKPAVDAFSQLWDEVLHSYPNRRVVWLAFFHPKARVRKKNRNRIVKYIAKAVKCDDR